MINTAHLSPDTEVLAKELASHLDYRVLRRVPEGPRKRAENHDPAPDGTVLIEQVRNSVAARKYLLKGIDPEEAFRFGIKVVEPQGTVVGRRTGVSRTLGPTARKKAGYRAQKPFWQRGNGRIIKVSSRYHLGSQVDPCMDRRNSLRTEELANLRFDQIIILSRSRARLT